MKNSLSAALALFMCFPVQLALAQIWGRNYGNGNDNAGMSVATDAAGNIYTTGYYQGTLNVGTTTLVGPGAYDVFVTKHDPNGNLQWVKSAGGSQEDYGNHIYTDAAGNSYIVGSMRGTVQFGTISLFANGDDGFLAKYDANGTCQWLSKFGGNQTDAAYGLSSDGNGNLYVTGFFEGTATFTSTSGAQVLTSTGGDDIFIAKFDASGLCIWAKKAGGSGNDAGRAITYSNGSLYLTGYFSSSMTMGTTTLTSAGNTDVFIAKYDTSGNCAWAAEGGGVTADKGYSITTDGSGNCYASGFFTNNATFGGQVYTSNPNTNQDQFILKYDASGNFVSFSQVTSIHNGLGIIVDQLGHVFAAGTTFLPSVNDYADSRGLCFDPAGKIISTGYFRSNSGFNLNIFISKWSNPTTSVANVIKGNTLTVFPNPASSTLLVTGIQKGEPILIKDFTGRIILEKTATTVEEIINISELPTGLYLLQTNIRCTSILKQ